MALKTTWPSILAKEKEYATLVYEHMRCRMLQDTIWCCSLSPEHVCHLKLKSDFWYDVLFSWCHYNYYHNMRLENQIIWYNSRIVIAGKPFLWGDLYKKGLVYVHQLYDSRGFRDFQELQSEFGYNSTKV